jgi:SAM-dependent methyltransferase
MDNSASIRLARFTWLTSVARKLGLLNRLQAENLAYNRTHRIVYCDARRRIPVADGSAEVVYTSHMLEHLDRGEAMLFVREARRVLCPGGTLRIAVPNLRFHVDTYLATGDADRFMGDTFLERHRARGLRGRVRVFFLGDREGHCVMYDPVSIVKLLEAGGFNSVASLPPNETRIPSPAPLDLSERVPESLFVEGTRPAGP